jgi:hypothetical protein
MKQKPIQKEDKKSRNFCEEQYKGKKCGIWVTLITSILTILFSLPFVNWMSVVNSSTLFSNWKLDEEAIAALGSKYNPFNILSFVRYSEQGSIGLYGMILFLLMSITVFLHIKYVYQVVFNKKGIHGNLSLYGAAQAAQLFSMITSVAMIGYVVFSNNKFGMTGFTLSPIVIIIFIFEAISYIIIKKWKLRK